MKTLRVHYLLILFLLLFQKGFSQINAKSRVIILSDIEADPDDAQSFVRLLLYSNQIDIKGMIATTSCWQKNRVAPESIKKIVKAYGRVQANLNKHEAGFPTENELLLTIKQGLAKYGMTGVGKGQDSEGSEWIIKTLEDDDPRPLHISVWGGANTLAQALFKLKETKNARELQRLISKLRVYTISDQDDSGIWIRNTFPDLHYIVSPGDDYGSATWIAINSQIKGISNEEISNRWLAQNIQQGHGPLGAAYPDVAWGLEGDTPAYLNLIPNGLNNPEHPNWGGWGGRYELYKPDFSKQKKGNSGVPFEPETRAIWTNATDYYRHFIPNNFGRAIKLDTTQYNDNKASLWRWREDFQNDFAARMDWCLAEYSHANHPPVPVINQEDEITVISGQGFGIDASDTYDPDGDSFSYLWFDYPEAGTYKKSLNISPENYNNIWLTAPEVEKQESVHIILKITDKGTPQLSRYKRIIVTVLPK
ncbi:nucleoside hydrolase-like domain-containing protein [Algoriphagus taiwanensis]|uniref:DUF1593 domain-containing protein n=1 Tax=Algoriphagus taiwanensis TaxID=1445656 RepID=A0ABQ6Q1A3_9BACT|nr:DUF1593 domain-containing protein [Algoriphagus taiwanensis]